MTTLKLKTHLLKIILLHVFGLWMFLPYIIAQEHQHHEPNHSFEHPDTKPITLEDSLQGFNEGEEIEHILSHGIPLHELDSYLENAKRQFLDEKYKLGLWAPPINTLKQGKEDGTAKSESSCETDNWGFESGDFSKWNTQGAVQIVNSGIDPYGGYSWVRSGNYSAKISSDNNCCRAGRIDRTINVPQNGQTLFTFHFAMSIFNFPHSSSAAAKFDVEVFGPNGNILTCPRFSSFFSTDLGMVGVNNMSSTPNAASTYNPNADGDRPGQFPVTYAGWNTVTMDLSGYAGQQVSIVFRVRWCSPGPDWAYALVDVDCPINSQEEQTSCVNVGEQTQICGPENMAQYVWKNPQGNVIENTKCINVVEHGLYTLDVLLTNIQCVQADWVTYHYRLTPNPIAKFNIEYEKVCKGGDVVITNQTTVTSNNISKYTWDYGDGITAQGNGTINGVAQTTGTFDNISKHYYNILGGKTIKLTAVTQDGCSASSSKTTQIIEPPTATITKNKDAVCENEPPPDNYFYGTKRICTNVYI